MIEFRPLLTENNLVKVVLNGGKQVLDDSTVPFSLAFDPVKIAEKDPTHVLVISIPHDLYKHFTLKEAPEDQEALEEGEEPAPKTRSETDPMYWIKYKFLKNSGKRQLYKLSKIDFIQFTKAGKHNLIFILLSNVTDEMEKHLLQKTSFGNAYENSVDLTDLDPETEMGLGISQGYCEALVDIPEVFFAPVPKAGIKKYWWKWVNRWFVTDPVDQCDFRKRVWVAMTVQLALLSVGLVFRFIVTTVTSILLIVGSVATYLIGIQSRETWNAIGKGYAKFTIDYRWMNFKKAFGYWFSEAESWNTYKCYTFGKHRVFRAPISPAGLCIQILLWYLYIGSMVKLFLHPYTLPHSLGTLLIGIVTSMAVLWHMILVLFSSPRKKTKEWFRRTYFVKQSSESPHVHDCFENKNIWAGTFRLTMACLLIFLCTQIHWIAVLNAMLHGTKVASAYSFSRIGFIAKTLAIILLILSVWKRKSIRRWYTHTDFANNRRIKRQERHFAELAKLRLEGTPTYKTVPITRTDWLKTNMNFSSISKKVDIEDIAAPTKAEKLVLYFKVGFWTTKAKVCKPYAR